MYGTNVVEFDFSFFDSYNGDQLTKVLESFPQEVCGPIQQSKQGTR